MDLKSNQICFISEKIVISVVVFFVVCSQNTVFSQPQDRLENTSNMTVIKTQLIPESERPTGFLIELLPNYDPNVFRNLWKSTSQEEINNVFKIISNLQDQLLSFNKLSIKEQKNSLQFYKIQKSYEHVWEIAFLIYKRQSTATIKKQLIEQWTSSIKTEGIHFIGLLKSFKTEEINIPQEKILYVKNKSWQIIEHSDNLLLLDSFCSTLLLIGNHDDLKKLDLLQKRFDLSTPSGYRACEIVNDTKNTLRYRLVPERGIPAKTGISPVTAKEFELLGPIVFLDEKTIKEREEAKAARLRAIQEEPEKATSLAKQLIADEKGRLNMLKIIGDIRESEVMRRTMKNTLSLYYLDKSNEQGEDYDEKASPDEVKKIKEILKSENIKIKSDALDIIRNARCVCLIPDLFEICYSKEMPPYWGFEMVAIDPKTQQPIRFQYSPTQVISVLGNEQVIPELEKLTHSITVSEAMKQDARLAIDVIKRRQQEEKERIASQEKRKRICLF